MKNESHTSKDLTPPFTNATHILVVVPTVSDPAHFIDEFDPWQKNSAEHCEECELFGDGEVGLVMHQSGLS